MPPAFDWRNQNERLPSKAPPSDVITARLPLTHIVAIEHLMAANNTTKTAIVRGAVEALLDEHAPGWRADGEAAAAAPTADLFD